MPHLPPKMEVAEVAKLSLCPCGFPVLRVEIGLGERYAIDPEDTKQSTMICGGCGRHIPVKGVFAINFHFGSAGYIPAEILKPASVEQSFSQ